MPTMKNLFGESITLPSEPTFEEEYQRYIQSAAWKRKVQAAIERAGNKCERCGISKWTVRLEGHHKTYERFKKEKLEDIEILCPNCHFDADEEREYRTARRTIMARKRSPLWLGFETWMSRAYGLGWEDYVETCAVEYQARLFIEYVSRFNPINITEQWFLETWRSNPAYLTHHPRPQP